MTETSEWDIEMSWTSADHSFLLRQTSYNHRLFDLIPTEHLNSKARTRMPRMSTPRLPHQLVVRTSRWRRTMSSSLSPRLDVPRRRLVKRSRLRTVILSTPVSFACYPSVIQPFSKVRKCDRGDQLITRHSLIYTTRYSANASHAHWHLISANSK